MHSGRLGEFATGSFVETKSQMADLGERPLRRNLGGCVGSVSPIDQVNLAAENQPLKFSSPETDFGQFVLPAINGLPQASKTHSLSGRLEPIFRHCE